MIQQIPLKDFFRNPESSMYKLSPDGTHLAYLAPYKSRMNIHIRPINGEKVVQITSVTERDIAGYAWANNNRLIYVRDFGGDENYHIFAVDKDGSDDTDLTPFKDSQAHLIDNLEDDDEHIIIASNKRDKKAFDAYRLNINTGTLNLLAKNPGYITNWMTDHEGKLRIATTNDGVNTSILYRATEADEFQMVLTTNFKETVLPLNLFFKVWITKLMPLFLFKMTEIYFGNVLYQLLFTQRGSG